MSLEKVRWVCLWLILILCTLVTPASLPADKNEAPKAANALDFANTYAVIVGVLHWEDKGLTPYPTENRKDQELYDVLRKRGVPAEHMILLLDDQGTLAKIRKSLQTISAKAKPESTLILYYAGHGWRTVQGDTQFANYDYHSKQPDKPALGGTEISQLVKDHFKGKRVLLFADCCHSGGLQDVARSLAQAKFEAAALTSADPLCASTNNWTFTQTLVDGFKGDPLMDANSDGRIVLGELAREVSQAMQFREKQKLGYATEGVASDFGLAAIDRDRKAPAAITGRLALKDYVTARIGARQRPGRIVGQKDDKYAVEFFNYSDKEIMELPGSALSKIRYKTYKPGDTVTVVRKGLHKAKVLEVAGDFHRLAFVDLPARGEEWLLSDRIVDDPESAAHVEWKGQWYPAIVLKTEGDKFYIHYAAQDDSWDEWVPRERIRLIGQISAQAVRNPFGVDDVEDPTGDDIKQFAAKVKLPGGAKDKNAEQWVQKETEGKAGSLDGEWSGRWDGGAGTAKIKVVKDRVYVLYTDTEGQFKDKTWLVEAVKEGKDRLVGRWVQVGNTGDTGPYVGLIVDDERIDGTWGGDARWDFRRKLKK